jgi:predicted AAA+ superfamily ATPase
VIDEVQRVPELLLAIKLAVDDRRRPSRFLLTGSADLMALPQVADSLAGRRGHGRARVFWQTQGSGKSYTKGFYSQKIQRKIPGDWQLSRQLSQKQQRHIRENLSEEELAMLVILLQFAPDLRESDRTKIKKSPVGTRLLHLECCDQTQKGLRAIQQP